MLVCAMRSLDLVLFYPLVLTCLNCPKNFITNSFFFSNLIMERHFCEYFFLFLAHLSLGHVSYCHLMASVIVVVNNFSKIFSSETTQLIGTKLGMNVSWCILHRTEVGIFDPSKNMAALTKNRT